VCDQINLIWTYDHVRIAPMIGTKFERGQS